MLRLCFGLFFNVCDVNKICISFFVFFLQDKQRAENAMNPKKQEVAERTRDKHLLDGKEVHC